MPEIVAIDESAGDHAKRVLSRRGSSRERPPDLSAASRRHFPAASPAPPFELLESKLLAPQVPGGSASREALVDVVESAGAVPVVFVSAGAGWGKTTLLSQWAARSRRPFAWVTVDEKDNDPIVLLTYVATALDRVSGVDAEVFEALASPGVSLEGTILPRLGAALVAVDEPLVLVLDDVHLLHDAACVDTVATLAGHVGEGSQLALSARGAPALPLGTWRARALALELGPEDLSMDDAQADQLLRAAGVELPEAEVAQLTKRTEGWPAGLYLAALSLRARKATAPGAGAGAPSGSNSTVSDYLQEELLAGLSVDEIRFLTRTSVLERLSGPLCDAVLEENASASVLESLARSNLFLVPLDRDERWYRYHHLFQQLLRSELSRAEPDLTPRLLARAADWCETNDEAESAIGYAQRAGDVDRVVRLVEHCGPSAYESGRAATAEGWFKWLEARGALRRNGAVAVLGALVATLWGRAAEAERRAHTAELADFDGTLPDGSASIDSWLALLRAHRCQRGLTRMREDAELAFETLAPASRVRPHASLLVALSRLLAGEIDEADDLFADAVEAGLELGAVEGAVVALGERAAVAIERGEWVQAEELAARALRVSRRSRMQDYPNTAFVCAVAARVALRRGETQRADELRATAQRLRPQLTYAMPWISVQTRLELARACLTVADTAGARTMLREIDDVLRRLPDLGTLPAQALELRLSLQTMRSEAPGTSTLTEAELRILPYLASHLSFREIGERIFLSRHTVKSHAMAIYRKLSVTSRTGAVERAGALGLIKADEHSDPGGAAPTEVGEPRRGSGLP